MGTTCCFKAIIAGKMLASEGKVMGMNARSIKILKQQKRSNLACILEITSHKARSIMSLRSKT